MGDVFNGVMEWTRRPFREDMDVWGWALFLLFTIVLTIFWTRVLKSVTG